MALPLHLGIDDVHILFPGIPARSSRGFLGYCTVVLLPSEEGWLLFDTGHYRAFRIGAQGIEFLTQIEWSLTGDVYPREKDTEIFRLVT